MVSQAQSVNSIHWLSSDKIRYLIWSEGVIKAIMLSNKRNFCGGAFDNWREVMLYEKCNGICSWCIERHGYHPREHVPVEILISLLRQDEATHVILLGGEPCLYPQLHQLVEGIADIKEVYLTTNGTKFTMPFIIANLTGLAGINISIHHYDLSRNQAITGITLDEETLEWAIAICRHLGIHTRFNCNLIKNEIDSAQEIEAYIRWAKERGVDRVRFAELKNAEDQFVDLAALFPNQYGLNENPYIEGCNQDAVLWGMPVNFRQMCGLQTKKRPQPTNPKSVNVKSVLYYDGKYYPGWQSQRR